MFLLSKGNQGEIKPIISMLTNLIYRRRIWLQLVTRLFSTSRKYKENTSQLAERCFVSVFLRLQADLTSLTQSRSCIWLPPHTPRHLPCASCVWNMQGFSSVLWPCRMGALQQQPGFIGLFFHQAVMHGDTDTSARRETPQLSISTFNPGFSMHLILSWADTAECFSAGCWWES